MALPTFTNMRDLMVRRVTAPPKINESTRWGAISAMVRIMIVPSDMPT